MPPPYVALLAGAWIETNNQRHQRQEHDMVIVLKATRQRPSEMWIQHALGETDEFGNPFELIELRWMGGQLHTNAEYAKTRGFDDAVIEPTTGGRIKITYRKGTGSAMWMRKGGIGPFTAYVPRTPNNMMKLASMYRDRLWRIMGPAVDAEVKEMSDKAWEAMSEKEREFNEKRVASLHTGQLESSLDGAGVVPEKDDKESLRERRKSLDLREKEIKDREVALERAEAERLEGLKQDVRSGKPVSTYSEGYIRGLKWLEMKSLAKKLGLKVERDIKSSELADMIVNYQKAAAMEQLAEAETVVT